MVPRPRARGQAKERSAPSWDGGVETIEDSSDDKANLGGLSGDDGEGGGVEPLTPLVENVGIYKALLAATVVPDKVLQMSKADLMRILKMALYDWIAHVFAPLGMVRIDNEYTRLAYPPLYLQVMEWCYQLWRYYFLTIHHLCFACLLFVTHRGK